MIYIKAVGRNIYSAESELTETIHIFREEENLLLEAVYDKETEQFLHAYEKYTFDEYTAKQNEILDGYSFECVIEWSEMSDIHYDNNHLQENCIIVSGGCITQRGNAVLCLKVC